MDNRAQTYLEGCTGDGDDENDKQLLSELSKRCDAEKGGGAQFIPCQPWTMDNHSAQRIELVSSLRGMHKRDSSSRK